MIYLKTPIPLPQKTYNALFISWNVDNESSDFSLWPSDWSFLELVGAYSLPYTSQSNMETLIADLGQFNKELKEKKNKTSV